ncbi:MAG: hypothetical protein K2M98_01535, partial [Muribaculum sp.]|nr:hypothetical protein [Muribaculum sp.]
KETPNGHILGPTFSDSPMETTLQELERIKCNGERAFIFKTDIARRYLFPTVDGEDFVTESVVFDRIKLDWEFIAVNQVLNTCDYMPDGLTRSIHQLLWNNPIGFMIYHYQRINQARNVAIAFKHALRYHAFRKIAHKQSDWSDYRGAFAWLVRLLAFTAPFGLRYYKAKRNRQ